MSNHTLWTMVWRRHHNIVRILYLGNNNKLTLVGDQRGTVYLAFVKIYTKYKIYIYIRNNTIPSIFTLYTRDEYIL